MKTGVMVINCARGGIVDENDLYEAIVSGKVAGAALDVFATEPPGLTPLITHERVIGTPHLGASTLEAQTNVAVAIARQIIDFFTTGTVANAVNMPAVSGEMLERVGPYLTLAERMGCLQAQLVKGPIKEVIVEFQGDFKELDLSPVPTAVLKGILAPVVKDDVNFVNAHILAQQRGIKVTETSSADSDYYVNQITVRAITTEMESVVSGTIFGKKDPRVVKINKFRLEMIPHGHMALIQNIDKPGSIGEIGTTLGRHQINIGKMQVGQEEDGDRNIIFLTTDTPIPEAVLAEMRQLSLVKTVTPLEF
jgi:D-3-phosphoglycerate dehydrogenase